MKLKLMMLLFAAVIGSAATAQKNKKANKAQGNAAAANNASEIKKIEPRNPFDTTKTKQAASPKKMKQGGKAMAKPVDNLGMGDDPFGKKANGLGEGEDPFDKSPRGKNRKKAAGQDGYIGDSIKTKKVKQVKAAGYANQEVSYMQQPANESPAAEAGEQAATSNPKQPSGIDNSPNSIYVRFELEDIIEYNKKTMTKNLNDANNETGWYKRVAVQPQGIGNVKVNYVKLYKTDGTSSVIQINQTVNAGVSTTVFNTGLVKETKNHTVTIEKINKVGVSYELLSPDENKKGTAIHVNLFK